MKLNIIGAGHVGRTLGRLFHDNRLCEIGDILNRSLNSAQEAAAFIGGGRPIADIVELTPADVVMISVSDAAIQPVAESLAEMDIVREGAVAFHCSGGVPSTALGALSNRGVRSCAIHPVKSFADPETCLQTFSGTFCGAEGDDRACEIAGELFEGCGARMFRLKTDQKEIYHAASVFVCNYLTTLLDVGVKCYGRAGVDREKALEVIAPLVMETVHNNLKFGPEQSLTGPIARGDHGLVQKHIEKLAQWDDGVAALYKELARATVDISRRKSAADAVGLESIETLVR